MNEIGGDPKKFDKRFFCQFSFFEKTQHLFFFAAEDVSSSQNTFCPYEDAFPNQRSCFVINISLAKYVTPTEDVPLLMKTFHPTEDSKNVFDREEGEPVIQSVANRLRLCQS